MTFSYIAFKNFRANGRRYLSFFMCSSFSIMVLLMFSTLKFNSIISDAIDVTSSELISASVIALIFFAFFFLNYAYSSFVKSRNTELGLFMTLGMNMKEISRLLLIENITIIGMSLLTGLVSGTIFSRLFFMVVQDILGLSVMNYELQLSGYIFTIGTFLIIFLTMVIYGNIVLNKMEINDLLKYDKISEKSLINHPIFGVVGLVMIISAYILKYADATGIYPIREISTKFTLVCLIGLYFFINQFCDIILMLFGAVKFIYIKNLLTIKELKHNLDRNKTALYIMTILSSLTMFFIGNSYASGLTHYGSNKKEAILLVFISSFLALLFFMSSVCMIFFKLFTGIGEEKLRYKKLLNIGITKREVSKYISIEIKVLFFIPTIISMLVIYVYTYLDNIKRNELQEILSKFLVILIIYVALQIIFYWVAKLRYLKTIIES